jgi:hypothetical protein
MKSHYHLIAEFPGCIPEFNEVFATQKDAKEALDYYIEDFTDEVEYENDESTFFLLKNNLRVYIAQCEGCELWDEIEEE